MSHEKNEDTLSALKPKLPAILSPCDHVRRSCYSLMEDELCLTLQKKNHTNISGQNKIGKGNDIAVVESEKNYDCVPGHRCVSINKQILHEWIDETVIPSLVRSRLQQQQEGGEAMKKIPATAATTTTSQSWDEGDWHYRGTQYQRPWLSTKEQIQNRYERVALYIMTLDTMNFCFWPMSSMDHDSSSNNSSSSISSSTEDVTNSSNSTNRFEYEHFAKALKLLAQEDDVCTHDATSHSILEMQAREVDDTTIQQPNDSCIDYNTGDTSFKINKYVVAEYSYALAPQNIIHSMKGRQIWMKFCSLLVQMISPCTTNTITTTTTITTANITNIELLPMMEQRWEFWKQLMYTLLYQYHGSASYFLSCANQSADTLVYNILSSFPCFRDSVMDGFKGRWIAFYKRAQIMVGDLWAALKQVHPTTMSTTTTTTSENKDPKEFHPTYCQFYDIEKLTTFADYRIPQLFHSLHILEYTPELHQKIVSQEILWPGCSEEIYIRAATIVTVDQIVLRIIDWFMNSQTTGVLLQREAQDNDLYKIKLIQDINAVTMDWYLWNLGETLDRQGALLYPHHRVRSIYY